MAIDFSKIEVENIKGSKDSIDVRQQLGNFLYYKSTDLAGSELGKRIYFSKEAIELSDDEKKLVLSSAKVIWQSYVMVHTFETLLG